MAAIAITALRVSDIELGDFVGVIGLGLVGNLAAQLVQLQGAVCRVLYKHWLMTLSLPTALGEGGKGVVVISTGCPDRADSDIPAQTSTMIQQPKVGLPA